MLVEINPIVHRAQMSRLFDEWDSQRVIFICAPAGYGKTVAMRQWQELSGLPCACISLDEYDNNISRFCKSFCAALCQCLPENERLREITRQHLFDASPEEYTLKAIGSLVAGKPALLSIDDLHLLHDEGVLCLLRGFIDRLPDSFVLMIASRSELPTPLSGILHEDDCFRISADGLRFVREDIVSLYERSGIGISMEAAREIEEYTRGWAMGIRALLLSRGGPKGIKLDMLNDFIAKSIWSNYDAKSREFMLNTAILNELLPPLCTALTGDEQSADSLERIYRSGAFIYKTGQDAYKYHDLFCEFLLCELKKRGESYTLKLYDRAGSWYLAKRDFFGALNCFSKSGNRQGIAECFLMLTESAAEFAGIEQLMSAASSPYIQDIAKEHPYIYSILMWGAFNKGQAKEVEYFADQYYSNHARIVRANPRHSNTIMLLKLIDYRTSLKDLGFMAVKTLMLTKSADIENMAASPGIINQNMPLMHRGTRDLSECAQGNASVNIMGLGKMLGKLLGGHGDVLVKCACSGVLYEQGQLEEALSHAQGANAAIKAHFSAEVKFIAMATHVYALDALEHQGEANAVMEAMRIMIENESAYYLSYNYRALCARREMAKGKKDAAKSWLKDYGTRLHEDLSFYKSYGHMTTCRAYMLLGDYDSAIILLQKLLALYTAYRRPADIMETNMLLAISYHRKNNADEGSRLLQSALSLAREYGYTQLFVNEESQLADMLSSSDNMQYTEKQLTVMRLLCEGKSYKEIAGEMNIKIPTLRSHLSVIYKKLDVSGELEAVEKIKALKLI